MYAKTAYYRNIIKRCIWIYFTLSIACIAEADTGHLKHRYTNCTLSQSSTN